MSHGEHFHEPRTSRRRIYPHGLVGPNESEEGEAAIETLMPSQTHPTHADQEELLLESRCLLMTEFIEAAHRAALANATILLTGDSGTGKSAFARQIHRWSRRSDAPFLSVDCAAISEHVHDSDPFEDLRNTLAVLHADRGDRSEVSDSTTLLLDNLVDLPPAAQARLLQFVEERQSPADLPSSGLHVRIIAASSRDLGGEVAAGRFRSDLFYRINVLALRIPTLVERRRDIPVLAAHLLARTAIRNVRNRLHLSAEAAAVMANYHWPGNVRELRNAIERAAVLCTSDLIIEEHLPDVVLGAGQRRSLTEGRPLTSLEEVERSHIIHVLQASSTMEEAAAALGINISTLWRKRKLYKIE
jgi:two-component system, NtrC family, response regulator AlgB